MSISQYPQKDGFALIEDSNTNTFLPNGGTLIKGIYSYQSNYPIYVGGRIYPAGTGLCFTTVSTTPAIDSTPSNITSNLVSRYSSGTIGTNLLELRTNGTGTYVGILGLGDYFVSTSGTSWSTPTPFGNTNVAGISVANGIFFANVRGLSQNLHTSTDGINWTTRIGVISATMTQVAYGNGVYVSGHTASNSLQVSTDLINWTTRSILASTRVNRVAYGNGVFVLNAGDTIVRTSTDGLTWASAPSFPGAKPNQLNYSTALGQFIVWTTGSTIYVTTNGTSWTLRASLTGVGVANTQSQLFESGSEYYFLGNNSGAGYLTSPDLITWTSSSSNTDITVWSTSGGPQLYSGNSAGNVVILAGAGAGTNYIYSLTKSNYNGYAIFSNPVGTNIVSAV